LILSYIAGFTFIIINLAAESVFIGDLKFAFNQFYIIDWFKYKNILFIIFYISIYIALVGYSFLLLIKAFRGSLGLRRTQLKYFIIISAVGFIGPELFFLDFFGFEIYPYSIILIGIFPIVMGYAIAKHKLLEIDAIIKKTLVFAGLFVFVYAVFACMAYLTQTLFQDLIGVNRWIAMIPSVAIAIFTLKPLEKFLISITDKYLFQKKYDYKELLNAFSDEVLTVLDIDKLADLAASKLVDIMKLDSCAVFLLDGESHALIMRSSRGSMDKSLMFPTLMETETIIKQSRPYVLYRSGLIMPIMSRHEVVGMVVMGKKMSDEEYSQEDLDILLPLSRALGIAISNADLFREYSMAQAKAAESEKMAAIGTLAASMAHEIRNPVTTIKIFSEYAPSKMNDPDFRNKYKNMVIKEVDKIDHIIQTLIDFSDSNTSIEKERVSLGSAIDDLISSGCVSDDAKKNIKFLANIPATLPDISFNRKELEEILLNLCQNASHAITDKGAIIFTAVEKEETVELRIMDTGCGMPEDLMENIFLPFFTTRSKGFGLGLFVVKELMIRNGGRISVVSRLGEGTTFTLEFAIAS